MTASRQPETLRLFVAVELPPEAVDALGRLLDGLHAADLHGLRPVMPNGIHLTLKFLGDVKVAQAPDLTATLDGIGPQAVPFTVELGDIGGFPDLGSPRVLWVGLAGDLEPLSALARLVDSAVAELGFRRETRPFNPHLTVARMRDSASGEDRRGAGAAFAALPWDGGAPIPIDSFRLIKSTLTPEGPIYETLRQVALSSPTPA